VQQVLRMPEVIDHRILGTDADYLVFDEALRETAELWQRTFGSSTFFAPRRIASCVSCVCRVSCVSCALTALKLAAGEKYCDIPDEPVREAMPCFRDSALSCSIQEEGNKSLW
jgi:hypothetical protein